MHNLFLAPLAGCVQNCGVGEGGETNWRIEVCIKTETAHRENEPDEGLVSGERSTPGRYQL